MGPLEQFSVLHIEGADAGEFLHAQLSNNIVSMSEGESRLAAYCEPKGRVLAVVLVYRDCGAYYLVLNATLAGIIAKRLQIYVLRSAVDISSCDATHMLYGLEVESGSVSGTWPYPADHSRALMLVSKDSPRADISPSLSSQQWNLADIQAGLVWLDDSTSGRFLPHALNLVATGYVDFNKGCYPGQEIIARIQYLGSVKRTLIRIEIPESDIQTLGQNLYYESQDGEEQLAGQIVAKASKNNTILILSVVKTDVYGIKLSYYINDVRKQTTPISGENTLS